MRHGFPFVARVRAPARIRTLPDVPRPRPLLLVDVDGVVSLFGFAPHAPPDGTWTTVDGIPHLLSATAGAHLRRLAATFDLAWCSGWEEKANDYLPRALALPGPLPHLSFDRHAAAGGAPQ